MSLIRQFDHVSAQCSAVNTECKLLMAEVEELRRADLRVLRPAATNGTASPDDCWSSAART